MTQGINYTPQGPLGYFPIEQLPDELFVNILSRLPIPDLTKRTSLASKKWQAISYELLTKRFEKSQALLTEIFQTSHLQKQYFTFGNEPYVHLQSYSPNQHNALILHTTQNCLYKYNLSKRSYEIKQFLNPASRTSQVRDVGNKTHYIYFQNEGQPRVIPYAAGEQDFYLSITASNNALTSAPPLLPPEGNFPYSHTDTKCALLGKKEGKNEVAVYNFKNHTLELEHEIQLPDFDPSSCYTLSLTPNYVYVYIRNQTLKSLYCYSLFAPSIQPKIYETLQNNLTPLSDDRILVWDKESVNIVSPINSNSQLAVTQLRKLATGRCIRQIATSAKYIALSIENENEENSTLEIYTSQGKLFRAFENQSLDLQQTTHFIDSTDLWVMATVKNIKNAKPMREFAFHFFDIPSKNCLYAVSFTAKSNDSPIYDAEMRIDLEGSNGVNACCIMVTDMAGEKSVFYLHWDPKALDNGERIDELKKVLRSKYGS